MAPPPMVRKLAIRSLFIAIVLIWLYNTKQIKNKQEFQMVLTVLKKVCGNNTADLFYFHIRRSKVTFQTAFMDIGENGSNNAETVSL
jgi:hypothetical protein